MRTRAGFAAFAASLILAAGSATAVAEDTLPPAGGEVWTEFAASDDDVAREGRAAMPFTTDQIEALGRLLQETQAAVARGGGAPPEGRIRRVRIGSPGEGAIPAIAVRKGYVTAVSFTDATGAPWPIEEVLVDGRFLPQAASEGGDGGGGGRVASHLLYLAPQARSLHGNAVIKLHGLAEPLVASIRGGGAAADFRVEVRLGMPGPNALPGTAVQAGFHAGDQVLLELLGGVAPQGAERLMVEGGRPGQPCLAPRRRPAAGNRRRPAVAGAVGGGARRRGPLGLPPPRCALRPGEPRRARDAAGFSGMGRGPDVPGDRERGEQPP